MADQTWGHCRNCRYFDTPSQIPDGEDEARCRQPALAQFELLVTGESGCNRFELRGAAQPATEAPPPGPL